MDACCVGEHRGDVCAIRMTCRTFWASEHPFPPTMRIGVCPRNAMGFRVAYIPMFFVKYQQQPIERRMS